MSRTVVDTPTLKSQYRFSGIFRTFWCPRKTNALLIFYDGPSPVDSL